ncbi:MAG: ABC transporter substrate-binding protein, partial [Chloroflexota bacterium]|nr:ABC transporter substrate-binding protein [Chloroflexota bacterium]
MNIQRRSTAAPLIVVALLMLAMLGVGSWHSRAADDDTLRLAGPLQGPETLDPAQVRDLSSIGILRQIYRGLVYYDENMMPVPEISSAYQISDDGLTYTFTLREGATFHDGSPVTADDVVFSLSRAVDPDTANGDISALGGPQFLSDIAGYSAVLSGEADLLEGVRALDDVTVQIEL